MLSIVIMAFASFFKIMNKNTKGGIDPETNQPYHYVDEYMGQEIVDAIVSMYLITLGEFDSDGFSKG